MSVCSRFCRAVVQLVNTVHEHTDLSIIAQFSGRPI